MLSTDQTRHFGTSSVETKSLIQNLKFPDEESFCSWFKTENEIVEWNVARTRKAPNSVSKSPQGTSKTTSKRGRPTTFEWTKYFTCSFGGTSRPRSEGTPKRTTLRPTRKVGCTAKMKVQKYFSSDTIFVSYLNSHSGHNINDLQTLTTSRIRPAMRNWLEKAVASGIEWKDIKRMTRAEVEKADFLGEESVENHGPIKMPDILRIKNQDFNNFRRKFLAKSARLHPDGPQSLSKHAEVITQAVESPTRQDIQEIEVVHSARIQGPGEKSLPDLTVGLSIETEARHESDDRVKAKFLEQVEYAKSYLNNSIPLKDEEREALTTITAQLAKLKRNGEFSDSTWSKRQCR